MYMFCIIYEYSIRDARDSECMYDMNVNQATCSYARGPRGITLLRSRRRLTDTDMYRMIQIGTFAR